MATPYRLRAARPVPPGSAAVVLGPHVRSYYAAATRNVVWAAAPFVLLLGYGVWLAHQGLLAHWFNSNFSAVAVTALFVMAIVLIVYTSAVGGGELVRVHANGILDLRTGPRAVRWDEIQSLTVKGLGDPQGSVRHVLHTVDGATLAFGPSIGDVHDLVEGIRARMAEHRLPDVRARIAEGSVVNFGAVTVSEAGVSFGARVVAWDAVADIEAEAGDLVVRDAQGARVASAKLDEVPNAFLLAEMAHDRRGK